MYPVTPDHEIAKTLNVPRWVIEKVAEEYGLTKQESNMSDETMSQIVSMYPDHANDYISSVLGVAKEDIERFAYRFGLRKSVGYYVNSDTEEEIELVRSWNREYDSKEHGNSKGCYVTFRILSSLFPGHRIELEKPIGGLRIDIFVTGMMLAVEFHGVQHTSYNNFFYGDKFSFRRAQERDMRKSDLCHGMGYSLMTVWHDEELSFSLIRAKIRDLL